jgi:hypothetical protein
VGISKGDDEMQTIEQIRAEVEAAKAIAEARFMAASGGRTARQFFDQCLRPEIKAGSTPQSAMNAALRFVAAAEGGSELNREKSHTE